MGQLTDLQFSLGPCALSQCKTCRVSGCGLGALFLLPLFHPREHVALGLEPLREWCSEIVGVD